MNDRCTYRHKSMGFAHVIPTDDRLMGLTVSGSKQESPAFF